MQVTKTHNSTHVMFDVLGYHQLRISKEDFDFIFDCEISDMLTPVAVVEDVLVLKLEIEMFETFTFKYNLSKL